MPSCVLLKEDGGRLLQEDGFGLLIEPERECAVAVEDSRTWPIRRHGRAPIEELDPVEVIIAPVYASASANVDVVGFEVQAEVGSVGVVADGLSAVVGFDVDSTLQSIALVSAGSRARLGSLEARSRLAKITGQAQARATVSGFAVATEFGRVSVDIGPDQVVIEDEELLWLLEVA